MQSKLTTSLHYFAEKVYNRQISAPILKRKSSRFGLGQFLSGSSNANAANAAAASTKHASHHQHDHHSHHTHHLHYSSASQHHHTQHHHHMSQAQQQQQQQPQQQAHSSSAGTTPSTPNIMTEKQYQQMQSGAGAAMASATGRWLTAPIACTQQTTNTRRISPSSVTSIRTGFVGHCIRVCSHYRCFSKINHSNNEKKIKMINKNRIFQSNLIYIFLSLCLSISLILSVSLTHCLCVFLIFESNCCDAISIIYIHNSHHKNILLEIVYFQSHTLLWCLRLMNNNCLFRNLLFVNHVVLSLSYILSVHVSLLCFYVLST